MAKDVPADGEGLRDILRFASPVVTQNASQVNVANPQGNLIHSVPLALVNGRPRPFGLLRPKDARPIQVGSLGSCHHNCRATI